MNETDASELIATRLQIRMIMLNADIKHQEQHSD